MKQETTGPNVTVVSIQTILLLIFFLCLVLYDLEVWIL